MTDEPRDRTEAQRPGTRRRRVRRGPVLGLLGAAGLAAAGLAIAATSVTSAPSLPDMISEQPGPPGTQVYRDGRLLMRFDGFVTNNVSAPAELEIYATTPNSQGVMQNVQQRVAGQPVATSKKPVVVYEVADGHRHYHLKNAAEYTLWTADRSRQVALAQKTEAGFCLEDSQQWGGNRPEEYSSSANGFCLQAPTPQPGPLRMGITPGYRDIYYAGLSYQWVDISNVAPGNYQLASRSDPNNVIEESDESNNGYAFRSAVVPGFLAKSVSVGRVDPGQSAGITLASDRFTSACFDGDFSPDPNDAPYCNPGSVRYRITSLPSRGVIRQGGAALGVGSVLTSGAITYTANAGQRGGDSFTYEAFDAGRTIPAQTSRPQAAVAIQVGAPVVSVAISGAQPSIVAGLSMQLSAVLTNSSGGVTWSTTAGSVTPGGLFTAPSTPGTATIRATSVEDPSATAMAAVQVTPAKVQAPAPTARDPFPTLAAGRKPLSALKVKRIATRSFVAKAVAGAKGGRLQWKVTIGRKVLKTKTVTLKARRGFIYRVTLKRGVNMSKVRVTARFTPKGTRSSIVRRSATLPRG